VDELISKKKSFESADFSHYSVAEIEERIKSEEFVANQTNLHKLKRDSRKGVRAIYQCLQKRLDISRAEKKRIKRLFRYELELWNSGVTRVAGIDEVGVGPLAGPVVSAAVIFDVSPVSIPVKDSKMLNEKQRTILAEEIRNQALSIGIGIASPEEIDQLNIYQATLLSMSRAVKNLALKPDHLLVDARMIPGMTCPQTSVIKGDQLSFSIASASIIAKTYRDKLMENYDLKYPSYGFRNHKGYATEFHRNAINKFGLSPIHRQSFNCSTKDKRFPALPFPGE
jgi:ribonuclease HII